MKTSYTICQKLINQDELVSSPKREGCVRKRAGEAGEEGSISAVLETLLRNSGKPVCITDLTTGEIQPVSPELAASPAGLLPLFLAAGDTVWRDTTGRRLGIKQVDDPQSLLGVRTESIGAGPVTPVLLSVMEAIAQAERPDMLLVNDMSRNWATATDRMRRLRLRPVEAKPASSSTPSPGGMQP